MNLRSGDWVEVRSQSEILATLDERGCLDGLPVMPQMLNYCGKRLQVSKRAHKLCDTVNETGARRLRDAVFLEEARCDGLAYGGCEMDCLLVWKHAWLKKVSDGRGDARGSEDAAANARLEELVLRNARPPEKQRPDAKPVYSCQATQMPFATTHLSIWDPRQYVEDLRSGNATLGQVVSVLFFLLYDTIATAGLGVGSFLRWSYDAVQKTRGGWPYPSRPGRLPRDARTPSVRLELQPGELVRVKSHEEVLATVNEDLLNRGMSFHSEMVPHCAKTFRVSKRIRRLMNEKTGELFELKNECIVLEGAPCVGRFTKPLLCPRGMYPYWREIWLERVDAVARARTTQQSPTDTALIDFGIINHEIVR